ncbi:MAG: hypothetical protein CL926_13635 [Deltaproteobacteria bacterium]|nr:hypothetical protein [Deltaproteobacteria bacterium]
MIELVILRQILIINNRTLIGPPKILHSVNEIQNNILLFFPNQKTYSTSSEGSTESFIHSTSDTTRMLYLKNYTI